MLRQSARWASGQWRAGGFWRKLAIVIAALFLWPFALLWVATAVVYELVGIPRRGQALQANARWAIAVTIVVTATLAIGATSPRETEDAVGFASSPHTSTPPPSEPARPTAAATHVVAPTGETTPTPDPTSTPTAEPSPTPTAEPPPAPTAEPPPPALVEVTNVRYTKETAVGLPIHLKATVRNVGPIATRLTFAVRGLKDYAEVVGCTPKCSSSESFGTYDLDFPRLGVDKKVTFEAEFLATKLGVVDWSLDVFADVPDYFFSGDATTVIR